MSSYIPIPYPKWLYGADGASMIVQDEDEHAALTGKWYTSPADIPGAEVVEPVEIGAGQSPDRAMMVGIAEAKGIKTDKRWSDARLSAEIEKAA
jgi:hypothetical protein